MHDSCSHHDSGHGHVCAHGPLGHHDARSDALCLDGVSYRYGSVVALEKVTLHVSQGCRLGVIGPNGGGKTTLLKLILGLIHADEGEVKVLGLDPREVCRRGDLVGYVPQQREFEARFPLSVRQVIELGLCGRLGALGRRTSEDVAHVDQLMQQVGVADLADRPIGRLSGGQQQRVLIARALASRPKILLLDEPTVGIDVAGQHRFAELIEQVHRHHGLTVVIVSHDLRAVAVSCEKIACLARTVHYHDAPAGLTPQILSEVFRHEIEPLLPQGSRS